MTWYKPNPHHWIRCEILRGLLGRVTVLLYSGETVGGLHKRACAGAWVCE
jgi:hypothetical protein